MSTKRFGVETSKTLGVRLPLDELALIEGAAAGAGQKPGVWAREVLLKAAAPDKPEWLGAPCPGCGKPIEVVVIGPEGTTCMKCWQGEYAQRLEQGMAELQATAVPREPMGWAAERAEDTPDDRGHEQRRSGEPLNEIAGGEPGGPRPTVHLNPSAPGEDPPAKPTYKYDVKTCANCAHTRLIYRVQQFNGPSLPGEDHGCPKCGQPATYAVGEMLTITSKFVENPLRYRSWFDEWSAMERMEPAAAMARLNELRAGRELPDGFRDWPKAGKISWLDRHWPL